MDVAMAEDTNHTRKGESAQNFVLIRKLALHLLRRETSVKTGFAAKQKRAGWAAIRRQAAAMFVRPVHLSSPIAVVRRAAMSCGMLPLRTCERSSR